MGGKTSGAALQHLTDILFFDLKPHICRNYLDDLVSGSKTFAGMRRNLELIFGKLRYGKLKIKARKCELFKSSVFYLGCRLDEEGLHINEAKCKDLIEMVPPTNRKGVQRFMGLANYFREFVPDFASKAKGITDLLGSSKKFEFGEAARKSFEEIKKALTEPPCLSWADPDKEFHLFTDASDQCIGFCLMQYGKDEKLHPVFYGSKCLQPSQLMWPSFVKEFYAAYKAITRLEYYLWGKKFTLYTDCQGMTFERTFKKCTTNAVLRWSIELSQYEFEIKFVKGSENLVADCLSRAPSKSQVKALPKDSRRLYDFFKEGVAFAHRKEKGESEGKEKDDKESNSEEESENVNLVQSIMSRAETSVEIRDKDFLKEAEEDRTFGRVREWVSKGVKVEDPMKLGPALRRYHNKLSRLSINQQGLLCLVYFNNKAKNARNLVCVPEKLIQEVIRVHHELAGGHLAGEKTMNRILQKFYFPNMKEEVSLFCKTCSECLRTNVYYGKKEGIPLRPIIYKYPGLCVAMDVVMVTRGGIDSKILTITDKFTKWVVFCLIRDETAKSIAKAFLDKWVCYWSVPEILITDNALSFKASEVMNSLYNLLSIEKKYTSPYHPEGNGEAERKNKVLLHMLQKLCDEFPKWKSMLGILQLAVNSAVNRSTGYSAFKLMTGREMVGLENICFDIRNNEFYQNEDHLVSDTYQNMKRVFEIAGENLELSHALQKKIYDRNKTHINLKEGDRVLLYRPKDTSNKYHKLKSHWQGPHVIIQVFDQHNFLIKDEKEEKEQIVHRNHLRKIPEGMRGKFAGKERKGEGTFEGQILEQEGEKSEESGNDTESEEEVWYKDVSDQLTNQATEIRSPKSDEEKENKEEHPEEKNSGRQITDRISEGDTRGAQSNGESRGDENRARREASSRLMEQSEEGEVSWHPDEDWWEFETQARACTNQAEDEDTSSGLPDLEDILRNLPTRNEQPEGEKGGNELGERRQEGMFRKPRYTETVRPIVRQENCGEWFREVRIPQRLNDSSEEENRVHSPPMTALGVPQGSSTPKLSVQIAEERRSSREMGRKCKRALEQLDEMDLGLQQLERKLAGEKDFMKDNDKTGSDKEDDHDEPPSLPSKEKRSSRDNRYSGIQAPSVPRRSKRNIGRVVDYYKEKNPNGIEIANKGGMGDVLEVIPEEERDMVEKVEKFDKERGGKNQGEEKPHEKEEEEEEYLGLKQLSCNEEEEETRDFTRLEREQSRES